VPIGYGIFAGIGAVTVLNNAVPGAMLTSEELMSLIFLILPIFALFLAIMVVYIIMALRPSKSFYDGNKYVEPEPLDLSSEGTTA
jgi:heme/copper-type cytochrome/quinol oxidase subunit 2